MYICNKLSNIIYIYIKRPTNFARTPVEVGPKGCIEELSFHAFSEEGAREDIEPRLTEMETLSAAPVRWEHFQAFISIFAFYPLDIVAAIVRWLCVLVVVA